MPTPTTISLIRHGHIVNRDNVYYGRLPGFSLSEQGQEEVRAAAANLRDEPVVAIFHSPMQRTRQTAEILQQNIASTPPLFEEPLLNEIYSPFDGASHEEMRARGWDFYTGVDARYEQPQTILNRMLSFLQRMRRLYNGQHVIGVTHADPLAFLWLWLLDQPLTVENRKRLDVFGLADDYPATASISTLYYETVGLTEKPGYEYYRPY